VLLVSHDRALLDAVSGRLLAIAGTSLVSYAGGWAEYRERATADPEPAPPRPKRERAKRVQPRGPSPIELVEREIERGEERVAELERQLAEDWTNVDLVAAHRAARADLAALLERWESLFEASPG
jgi:ATPase subunit of ABC transporter with duplicated ATPase domains